MKATACRKWRWRLRCWPTRCTRRYAPAGCTQLKKTLTKTVDEPSSKSERSEADSSAPMGYGATRSLERVAAAMGALAAAPIVFEPARDAERTRNARFACRVPQAGVLLALPALLAVGLLAPQRGVVRAAGRLLWPDQRVSIAGVAGTGPHPFAGAVALSGPGRVGESAGAGPDSGSADAARESEVAVCATGPSRSLECGFGQRMDLRTRAGTARAGLLRGRARAGVPRRTHPATAALCSAAAVLSAGHRRLLDQCARRTAILLAQPRCRG